MSTTDRSRLPQREHGHALSPQPGKKSNTKATEVKVLQSRQKGLADSIQEFGSNLENSEYLILWLGKSQGFGHSRDKTGRENSELVTEKNQETIRKVLVRYY